VRYPKYILRLLQKYILVNAAELDAAIYFGRITDR
jgi:hypothetical protein